MSSHVRVAENWVLRGKILGPRGVGRQAGVRSEGLAPGREASGDGAGPTGRLGCLEARGVPRGW